MSYFIEVEISSFIYLKRRIHQKILKVKPFKFIKWNAKSQETNINQA
jgi:hypothetical protein